MDNDTIIQKITEIATKQEIQGESITTLQHKVEEINALNTNMAILSNSMNELKATMSDYITIVNNVSNESTKDKAGKWTLVTNTIITAIVTTLVAFCLFKLGLK